MKVETPLTFNVTTPQDSIPGSALIITLPYSLPSGSFFTLSITYTTLPSANAFSWLKPSQTLGKSKPYLFTQCQALACRSVAPMQDTPAVKITYDSNVTIPNDLRAKMSANSTGYEEVNGTHTKFMFRNDMKIPSYLIALAVGDIKYHSLGRRVGVISEPE